MGPDRLEVGLRRGGTAAASVLANVSVLAAPIEPHELLDRRRLVGLDAVGVVGRVAEQRVGSSASPQSTVSGPAVCETAVTPGCASIRISVRVLKRGPSTWP